MIPESEFSRVGAKAAVLTHLQTELPKLPIPPFEVAQAGSPVPQEVDRLHEPLMARSSSTLEGIDSHDGLYHSERVVYRSDLDGAIARVRSSQISSRAKTYALNHGFPESGEMHVIVQEDSGSEFYGSMMRHPNNPDLIFLMYKDNNREPKNRIARRFVLDETTGSATRLGNIFSRSGMEEEMLNLATMLRDIEQVLGTDRAWIVEFGLDPVAIYQARAFKSIETANFNIPHVDDSAVLKSQVVFGVTSEDGVVFPAAKTMGQLSAQLMDREMMISILGRPQSSHDLDFLMDLMNCSAVGADPSAVLERRLRYLERTLDGAPYALVSTSIDEPGDQDDFEIDLLVPHMRALITGGLEDFLSHNTLRLLRQAEVTVGFPIDWVEVNKDPFYQDIKSIDDNVRIISNGREVVVFRETREF